MDGGERNSLLHFHCFFKIFQFNVIMPTVVCNANFFIFFFLNLASIWFFDTLKIFPTKLAGFLKYHTNFFPGSWQGIWRIPGGFIYISFIFLLDISLPRHLPCLNVCHFSKTVTRQQLQSQLKTNKWFKILKLICSLFKIVEQNCRGLSALIQLKAVRQL